MSEDGDERPTLDEVRGHLSVLRAAMDNALPGAEHRRAREEADRLQVVLDALDERTRKLTLESCKRLVADNEIARLRAASDDSCGTSNGTSPCGPCGVCRECLRDSARSAQARADAMQQRAEKAERALAEAHNTISAGGRIATEAAQLRGTYANLDAKWDSLVRELRDAQRDLAEARSQLAALHAACVVLDNGRHICRICRRSAFPGEPLGHEPTCALADLATAAREHDAKVRAPVEAERDTLAMALAEVSERWRMLRANMPGRPGDLRSHHDDCAAPERGGEPGNECDCGFDDAEAIDRAIDASADLAAQREARIRADERAKALRDVAAYLESESADDTRDYCTHLLLTSFRIRGR